MPHNTVSPSDATTAQDAISTEQAVVTKLYIRLDELRERTRKRLAEVRSQGAVGTHQNRSERDSYATLYENRLAQLEAVEDRLCFGRLDVEGGEVRYVGRIGFADDEHTSMLTDWRADAARPFYQATALNSFGVVRRRHIRTRVRDVIDVEDDLLDLEAGAAEASQLRGDGALMAALNTARTGKMHDIVATIQAEQDAIVRADPRGVVIVQGGPGTGKTAVALHRAAYLLYAHRETLSRQGVLIVGPSRAFLSYIDHVLPSLGETGVVSTTLGNLLPGITATGGDSPRARELKGDVRMAEVVARAIRVRQRVPAEDQQMSVNGRSLTITQTDVRAAIGRARRSGFPHNKAREVFVREMLTRLTRQYFEQANLQALPDDEAMVMEELRSARDIRVALNLCWLPYSATQIISDLWAKPHRLAEAAPWLSAANREVLARPTGSPWSVADIPLIDEAAMLLGPGPDERPAEGDRDDDRARALDIARRTIEEGGLNGMVSVEQLADRFAVSGPRLTTAEQAAGDRNWVYGHVIVDEAQELSAMDWRAIIRRCPSQSMTVVGDTAQRSSPAGTRSWAATGQDLFTRGWTVEELTVNYRTPSRVMEYAEAEAHRLGVAVSPTTAARDVEDCLEILDVDVDAVPDALRQAVAHALDRLPTQDSGTVGVIATATDWQQLSDVELPSDSRVSILTPTDAKGLEFDCVIVVNPDTISAGESGGADLYVALTRPTQYLQVIRS